MKTSERSCPYQGLRPFEYGDREYFFGRSRDQKTVVSNLYGSSLTVLYGASGVGKTSLLLAGVVPELENNHRVAPVVFRKWQSQGFLALLRSEILNATFAAVNRGLKAKNRPALDHRDHMSTAIDAKLKRDHTARRKAAEDRLLRAHGERINAAQEKLKRDYVVQLQSAREVLSRGGVQRLKAGEGMLERDHATQLKLAQERLERDHGERLEAALEELKREYAKRLEAAKEQLANEQAEPPRLETLSLDLFMIECANAFVGRIFFVLDQFEEYFLYHSASEDVANEFDSQFAVAVNSPDIPVSFLVSLRDDGLSKLDRLKARIPNLLANTLRLEHLDRADATEAILKPLEKFNNDCRLPKEEISIDPALTDALLEVRTDPLGLQPPSSQSPVTAPDESQSRVEMPFFQLVLKRLWTEEIGQGSRLLSFANFDELGRAKKIVGDYVQDLMSKDLSNLLATGQPAIRGKALVDKIKQVRSTAARLFRYLITSGGAKYAPKVSVLAEWAELDQERVFETLEVLSELGLLRCVDIAAVKADRRYEIFHDVLGRALREWREEQQKKEAKAEAEKEAKAALKKVRNRWLAIVGVLLAIIVTIVSLQLIRRADELRRLAEVREAGIQSLRLADNALLYSTDPKQACYALPAVFANVAFVKQLSDEQHSELLVPVRALVALNSVIHGSDAIGNLKPEEVIPVMLSPDLKNCITVSKGNQLVVWSREFIKKYSWQLPLNIKIRTIGFDKASTRFAVEGTRQSDSKEVVAVYDLLPSDHIGSASWKENESIEEVLGLDGSAGVASTEQYVKKCPTFEHEGIFHSYEEKTSDWLLNALQFLQPLSESQKRAFPFGVFGIEPKDIAILPTEMIVRAGELAFKDRQKAKELLADTMVRLSLTIANPDDFLEKMSGKIAATYLTAGDYFALADPVDEMRKALGDNPGDISKSDYKEKAISFYNRAREIYPKSMASTPEERFKSNALMVEGNKARAKGNRTAAEKAYTEAKLLAPDNLKDLDPKIEAAKPWSSDQYKEPNLQSNGV
jgi:hypothetical protein